MIRKILLIGPILKTYGGVSRFQEDLLNTEMDYKFMHFNTARPPKMRSLPIVDGYNELFTAGLVRAIIGIMITIWHVLKFPFIILRKSPDIVHIASVTYWVFWESAAYLLISKMMGCKAIFHMLGPFDIFYQKSGKKIKFFIQTILQKADRVICLSDRDKDFMSIFLPSENISVLRSNVRVPSDLPSIAHRGKKVKSNILFLGGVDPFRKGIYDILKALPIVINARKDVIFLFAGGENVKQALDQALRHDLMPWVSFLGWVSEAEKWRLYQQADLLLLPSCEEGLPYVLIEAMLSGLPIITTPVGGIPEVIREGRNGYLVNPGDFEALADRIISLSRDERLRLSMGKLNQEQAQQLYSQESIFRELENIYDYLTDVR
jgi:glycosyltransferase involved in cell wall biosynthesis